MQLAVLVGLLLTAALGYDNTCDSDFCRTEGWTSDFDEDDLDMLYTYEDEAKALADNKTRTDSPQQLFSTAVGFAEKGDFQQASVHMKACALRAPDNLNYDINLGEY